MPIDYAECTSSRAVLDACNNFEVQLKALNSAKAIEDTSSMFQSIKAGASTAESPLGRKTGGTIWIAHDDGRVLGLMRLKDEGQMFHLLNVVGIPRAGAGEALIDLAKAVAMSLDKPLKLEAAHETLFDYYRKRSFDQQGQTSVMIWTHDKT